MMSVSFPTATAGDEQKAGGPSPSCSCTLKATVTVKATWTHDDTTQTDTTDPAPTKVWIIETGGATWEGGTNGVLPAGGDDGGPPPPSPFTCSGSASDDIPGDQYVALPVGGPPGSGKVYAPPVTPPPPPAPPPIPLGWSKQDVSGTTFTLTHQFSATGTATYNNAPAAVSATCSVGSYTITIHAQPYGLYDAGFDPATSTQTSPDVTPGGYANYTSYQLIFRYKWRSTSGNLADLRGIDIYDI